MTTIAEVKRRLKGIKGHVAVAVWCREDVIGRAAERDIVVTPGDADSILDMIDNHQDCEYGISWYTLDATTDEFIDNYFCPKCGSHWATHDGDGSCVVE